MEIAICKLDGDEIGIISRPEHIGQAMTSLFSFPCKDILSLQEMRYFNVSQTANVYAVEVDSIPEEETDRSNWDTDDRIIVKDNGTPSWREIAAAEEEAFTSSIKAQVTRQIALRSALRAA